MNRSVAVRIAALLAVALWGFGRGPAVRAAGTELAALDRAGRRLAALTDGDAIRLRLTFAERVWSTVEVTFKLDSGTPVAECRITPGGRGCQSELFASLGWRWDPGGIPRAQRTVQAWIGDTLAAESAPLQVAPRPVVMVHGFNSDWQAWTTYLGPDGYLAGIGVSGFAVGDGQAAGIMNTGKVTAPTIRTNTIAENAAILGEYIAQVKSKTGAEQVDLVAHSMGGLISRYYIDRVMKDRDIGQFITLGTPNAGTDCANLPGSLGMLHPATLEIRPSYVNGIFNPQVTRLKGVPYHAIAGTSVENPVSAPCTQTPTDLVVSLPSAAALPIEVLQVPFYHHELNYAPEVFETAVKPLLQAPAGSFNTAQDPVLPLAEAETLTFTRVYTGLVVPGGSQSHVIQIESGVGVASFALFDLTRSLTVSVRGASGNVIALDPDTNGLVTVDDPATLVHLGYGFANPNPGPWEVTLAATGSTPAAGAPYAITAHLEGGAALQAQVDLLLPRLGETVHLSGALNVAGQPVSISTAQAIIRDPASLVTVLDLAVVDGMLQGSWAPSVAGPHAIDVIASGRLPEGTAVERTAFLAVEAQPQPNLVPTYIFLGAICLAGVGVLAVLGLVGRALGRRARRGPQRAR